MIFIYNLLTQKEEITEKRSQEIPMQVTINGDFIEIRTDDDIEILNE